jgi:hypothetical protein
MLTSAKINIKKYLLLSASILLISVISVSSLNEIGAILLVYLASCANQWMLVTAVREASKSAVSGAEVNKWKMIFLVFGKFAVIAAALIFSIQIMQKKVLIPVLIYVLQIAVLYLSFEKNEADSGSNL